ncbi:permease, partial [Pseudomonas sp. BAgro211]|nr:permease [Pseudomonas sp. BAgro211]
TLYPVLCRIKARTGLKDGHAATLLVLFVLLVLIVPIYLMAMSITESAGSVGDILKSGTLHVPAPQPSVAEWPLIGPRVYGLWLAASTSLT